MKIPFIFFAVVVGFCAYIISQDNAKDVSNQTKHAVASYYFAGIYILLLGILINL